jgi:hypothetical protein
VWPEEHRQLLTELTVRSSPVREFQSEVTISTMSLPPQNTQLPEGLIINWDAIHHSEVDLVANYWAVDVYGKWKHTVNDIALKLGISKRDINEIVSTSHASDSMTRCHKCDSPRRVSSRTEFMSREARRRRLGLPYKCDQCVKEEARVEKLRAQAEEDQERARLKDVLERHLANQELGIFNYDSIEPVDAVHLYCIMLHSDDAIVNGRLGNLANIRAFPTDSLFSDVLANLHQKRILLFSEDTTIDALGSSENSGFSYYPLRVDWQIASEQLVDYEDVFRKLERVIAEMLNSYDGIDAINSLWWAAAEQDTEKYLREQLRTYGFYQLNVGPKLKEAFRYGLERFSVPRLRYFIYRIARNVAALAMKSGFTKAHALNTIPAAIIRDCDRALADRWTFSPYCFKWDEEESPVWALLFDRILGTGIAGFKETSGVSLNEILAKHKRFLEEEPSNEPTEIQ